MSRDARDGVLASAVPRDPTTPLRPRYASRADRLTGSIIDSSTSILAGYDHDIVRFAMGSPAADAIPARLLGQLAEQELGTPSAYDYAASEGDPGVREQIVELERAAGRTVDPARILVTSGGMQGLDLTCKLFVEPGDLVVTEAPTYTNGTATIASYQGDLLEISVDDQGMRIDELEDRVASAGRTPSMIYTIPNFQNPSGTTLSLARRERLVELAERWGSVLLEDDPYGLLGFDGDRLPGLAELTACPGLVVGVRTFSKILAPGLRLGWVEADPRVIALMIRARQAMDTCSNLPAQRLADRFLRGGHLTDHLARVRASYVRRRDAMDDELARAFGGGAASWTRPAGGMFTWLTLPESIDTGALFEPALDAGVAFIPGAAFSVEGRFGSALRLCFATNDPERIRLGVERLRGAIDRHSPGVLDG